MAESKHEAGIRITGDASGAVDAHKQVAEEQKKLAEQTRRTTESAKAAAEESRRFVERLKEQAETVGKTRAETERYRASQISLTDAQRRSVDVSVRQIEAYDKKQQALRFVGRAAAAAAVLIVAYGTAVAASAKATIDQAAALHNLSQSYGITTETLSAYLHQMKLAGVGQAEFSLSMKALAKNISEARGGAGDGASIFKLLGKDIESAVRAGASMQELLPLLADRFASFADGPNKAALAMALFGGRVGEQLIPELNKGAAGFRAAAREAAEFGSIVGETTARQAEELNTNLARTNALLTAQGAAMTRDALPALNRYLEQLIIGTRIAGGFMAAIGRFGFMNPDPEAARASAESSLGSLREQRGRLTGRRASGPLAQSIDERIRAEEQRRTFAQFLVNQRLSEGGRDPNSALFEFAGGGIGPPKAQAPGLPRAGGGGGRTAAQIMAELSGVNANFTDDLKTLHAEYARGAMSLDTYRTAVERLIQAQQFAQDLAKQEAEWLEQATKTIEERRQAWIDEGVARANAQRALEAQVEQLELETSVMVLSNDERERALALHELEQQALTLTAEKYEELRARVNAAYDTRVAIGDQDARIRAAIESQQELDAQAKRSAQAFEQAVATGIMLGFRRGGRNLGEQLRSVIEDSIATAMLTPLATRIGGAVGGAGQFLAGQGNLAMSFGNWFATSRMGQSLGMSRYEEDAAGNVSLVANSGAAATAASYIPYVGAAIMAASVTRNRESRRQFDEPFREWEAELGMEGGRRAQFNPFGAYMAGDISFSDMATGMLAPGLIRPKGLALRSGTFGGALGAPQIVHQNWFDEATAGGVGSLLQRTAIQEQNLIRNLGLSPLDVASISAGLPSREYGFGREHTPWEQSPAFYEIQAERLAVISGYLGRSIEELTAIMSASAEEWQEQQRQWQAAVGVLRARISGKEDEWFVSERDRLARELGTTAGGYAASFERLAASPDAATTFGALSPEALAKWERLHELVERVADTARVAAETAFGEITSGIAAMQGYRQAVLGLRGSVEGSMLAIRSSAPGFDAVSHWTGEADRLRAQLARAGTTDQALASGDALRAAIEARYDAEIVALEELRGREASAQADRIRAIDEERGRLLELERALAGAGDAAQAMLLDPNSPLLPRERFEESQRQAEALLKRARGMDPAAIADMAIFVPAMLEEARSYLATNPEFIAIFERYQGALEELGAAGPGILSRSEALEEERRLIGERTGTWQQSLEAIQGEALGELQAIATTAELWNERLTDAINESAIRITELKAPLDTLVALVQSLAQETAEPIIAAFEAKDEAAAAALRAAVREATRAAVAMLEANTRS